MTHVSGLRTANPEIVLRVQGLRVAFRTSAGLLQAVRGVDFEVGVGETVALVGESGSGKSASVLGMLGLFHPESALVRAESLEFEDAAIVDADGPRYAVSSAAALALCSRIPKAASTQRCESAVRSVRSFDCMSIAHAPRSRRES